MMYSPLFQVHLVGHALMVGMVQFKSCDVAIIVRYEFQKNAYNVEVLEVL